MYFHKNSRYFLILFALIFASCSCSSVNSKQNGTTQPKLSPTPTPEIQKASVVYEENDSIDNEEIKFGDGLQLKRFVFSQKGKFNRKYEANVHYPQIEGSDRPALRLANKNLARLMKKVFQEFLLIEKQQGKPTELWKDVDSTLFVYYKLIYGNDEFISIRFYGDKYGAGAAHSVYLYWVANVDLRTGKNLKLSDLFVPNSGYLKRLSEIILQQERERKLKTIEGYLEKEFLPEQEKYLSWNVTEEDLLFSFEECRIAACADPPIDFLISPDKLKDILNPNSVVMTLWKT